MRISAFGAACLILIAAQPAGAEFTNGIDSMAVDTPQGKFECANGKATSQRQVLRLAGRVIFEEKPSPDGIVEDTTLRHGIEQKNVGCPWVVAVQHGYVIIGRDLQPPSYGVQNYAVIDFNKPEPSLTPLSSGQRPQDDKISMERRIKWSGKSFTLHVFGYAPGEECCAVGASKARPVEVRYIFSNGQVEVVR